MFATLDPTLRRIELPEVGPAILADTVGFIRHLPHDLVNAFHATLQEVCEADLLLHVIDAQDEDKRSNRTEVDAVLESIGAANVPQILVYNKIDLCKDMTKSADYASPDEVIRTRVSALTGSGMDELTQAIARSLGKDIVQNTVILPPDKAKLRAELYQSGAVISERTDEAGHHHLLVRLPKESGSD